MRERVQETALRNMRSICSAVPYGCVMIVQNVSDETVLTTVLSTETMYVLEVLVDILAHFVLCMPAAISSI
jgi:hypothetical protein